MAYADLTRTATAGVLTSLVGNLFAGLIAQRQAARTRRALSALSERELNDIGLCYADIDAVVARNANV